MSKHPISVIRSFLAASAALASVAAGAALMSPSAAAPPSEAGAPAQARKSLGDLAGVPAGWQPRKERNGDVIVAAPDVTLRRVEVVGGRIDNNAESDCFNGLRIVRSTVRAAPGQRTSDQDLYSIGTGGYTAQRVEILGTAEGFRVGGS